MEHVYHGDKDDQVKLDIFAVDTSKRSINL